MSQKRMQINQFDCILKSVHLWVTHGKLVHFKLIKSIFVWFDSLHPINNLSVKQGRVFLGWTSTKIGWMCLPKGPQCSDAGEARTRGPSVSSQALYHWATALPNLKHWKCKLFEIGVNCYIWQNFIKKHKKHQMCVMNFVSHQGIAFVLIGRSPLQKVCLFDVNLCVPVHSMT